MLSLLLPLISKLPAPPLPRLRFASQESESAHRSAAAAACRTDSRRFHGDRRYWQPTSPPPTRPGVPWLAETAAHPGDAAARSELCSSCPASRARPLSVVS